MPPNVISILNSFTQYTVIYRNFWIQKSKTIDIYDIKWDIKCRLHKINKIIFCKSYPVLVCFPI